MYLFTQRGALIIGFALAGLLLSVSYTSFLKRAGLGELTALIVWGPLMIGGTAFAASGAAGIALLALLTVKFRPGRAGGLDEKGE